jgi:hypothetical protein
MKLDEFFRKDDAGWDSKTAFEVAKQQVSDTISFSY